MKTVIHQLFLILALAISLYSCKGGGGTDTTGDAKKIFRYNQTGGLTSLDPAFANKRANIWAVNQIYNGLFSFSKNLDVHPELVKEWNISEDGKMYTFTIKRDVRFHDNACFPNGRGRELKASDFVYSFKRILDPATGSTGSWIFNDKVLQTADGKPSDTCFVAIDDYRFRVHLKRRFPAFLQILAMPYAYVVPKEGVDKYGKDFRANPVGTGAFMLQKWEEKNSMLLAKNTRYWKRDAKGNQLPYLDAIQVSFIEDRNQEFLTFEQGKLEFISNISETSKDQILEKNGEIKEKFAGKFKVDKIPYLNTEYVGFYLEGEAANNPLLNVKVRQALSYAVDRKGLVSLLRNGLGTPGDYGIVPIALPSFDSAKVKGYPFNPKKAQELLKEAGFPGGKDLPSLKLHTYSSDKEIAEFLQKGWSNIGVKVEIISNQFAAHQEIVDNGKSTLFRGSWLGDYPDAENYLAMFYSKNLSPVGPNKTHYKNENLDKIYLEAHETDNLFTRYEDYLEMDQLLMNDAPIIVLYYDEIIHLKQNYVVGLEADPMNNLILENVDFKSANSKEVAQN